ncbi:oligosaccharide flippase family protein [Porifericola rhodea]|uniref:lipopolysaccharide biosynthesis protein n=1 Tax=Porifericola rhodea TaxID=930972 RepID=UPI002665CFE9|nr:oligosaccharide flippase family protein [Porifericola rhodea]WKN30493.1 oligosaccharide flippase family protein [Porifericola rhodea]
MILQKYKQKVVEQTKSKKFKQILSMLTSSALGIGLGIGTSVINTRLLGPESFGDFKFIQSIFNIMMIFFSVGIFHTGGRLIADKQFQHIRKKIFGGLFGLTFLISGLFIATVFVSSYVQEYIFDNNLGYIIRYAAPFTFVFVFKIALDKFMEGDNLIHELAIFQIAPKVLYVVFILIASLVLELNLMIVLGVFLLTQLVSTVYGYSKFSPDFSGFSETSKLIFAENKDHGFQIYIGALVSNGTLHLSSFIIAYYLDNTNVGYFNLANTIATPLSMIPQVVGTAYFKDFANSDRIPKKVISSTILISLLAFGAFILMIKYVIVFLYSEDYLPVVTLIYYISFAYVIQGLYLVLNRFLSAHGIGRELKNASFIRGAVNIIGFVVLIKLIGTVGACITLVFSNVSYFLYLAIQYKNFVAKRSS